MNLVAGAIEKAGVDEDHPFAGCADAFLEVDRGAPLFVHDADLDGIGRQAERSFDMREDVVGKGDFLRAMHLGFDDVDRVSDRIADAVCFLQVVQRDGDGAHCIQQTFEGLVAVAIEHRRVGHQMPDIAHQHQRAAFE